MAESAAYHPRSATEIQREADRKEAERAAELIQFECRMQNADQVQSGLWPVVLGLSCGDRR